MKEELTKYYKNEISLSGMVYKHMKFQSRMISFTTIVSLLLLTVMPFAPQFEHAGWIILGMYGWVFLTILSFFWFAESAKKIVTTKHYIEVEGEIWNNTAFKNKQEVLLKRYLISHGLFTKRKIDLLYSSLKDDVNKTKFIPPIIQTVLVSVIVTGITKSSAYFFDIDISNKNMIIIFSIIILIILIFIMSIVINIIEKYKHYFFRKIYYKKPLISQLEDVLLRYFD